MTTSFDGLKNYSMIETIGAGGFGVVRKAVDIRTGKIVALKRVVFRHVPQGTITSAVIRELSVMRELNHPNIVRLEDIIIGETDVHLAFEYLHSDLREYIKQLPEHLFMERWLQKSYQYQILQGMCYCHQRSILHRDMKPSNLLINTYGVIKIGDFGLSRVAEFPARAYTDKVATVWYRAPELILGSLRYTTAIDMWSIGCIFGEMATKNPLFPAQSPPGQIIEIISRLGTPTEENWKGVSQLPLYSKIVFPRHEVDCLDDILSPYLDPIGIAIIRLLVTYDPAKRISAKQLLKHPYYSDVDRSKLPDPNYDGTLDVPPRFFPDCSGEEYPSDLSDSD